MASSNAKLVQRKPVKFDRIAIRGNERTKSQIIRRAVEPIKHVKNFNGALNAMTQAHRKLQALGIFEAVDFTIDGKPDSATLIVSVKEKGPTTLQTGTYINGDNAEGSMEGHYMLRNYFGTAERFHFSTSVGHKTSNNFKFEFTKPSIAASELTFGADLNKNSTFFSESSFTENSQIASVSIEYPMQDNGSKGMQRLALELGDRQVTPTKDASKSVRDLAAAQYGHSFKAAVRGSINFDTRDQPMTPTSGTAYNFSIEAAATDFGFLKPQGSIQSNWSPVALGERVTFSATVAGGWLLPLQWASLATSRRTTSMLMDRFQLGASRVRGFEVAGFGPRDARVNGAQGDDALGGDLFGSGFISVSGLVPHKCERMKPISLATVAFSLDDRVIVASSRQGFGAAVRIADACVC